MAKGISIYPGLDNTFEENLQLIDTAAKLGIKRIFTSTHIPETNHQTFQKELWEILHLAHKNDMDVVADVSPKSLELLGLDHFDVDYLYNHGITTFRLDYGFSLESIAQLTNHPSGAQIQLNASTLTADTIQELLGLGAKMDNLEALHNFFPRQNTGLSEDFVLSKNNLFHRYNIAVGGFIPEFTRPRGPIQEGLPTLELHRHCDFDFALRHMQGIGMDSIFIGDSLPSLEHLQQLSQLPDTGISLRAQLLWDTPLVRQLLEREFTSREDEAQDVLRTQESRQICHELLHSHCPESEINPANNCKRSPGAITLDNKLYQRYAGELQITKVDLPPDSRVNVIAQLPNTELSLLQLITPNTQFRILYSQN